METIKKEHSKEVEVIRSGQETESKNIILLLQKQNVTLESKAEKLQIHIRTMEGKVKELLNTIDEKVKIIHQRDHHQFEVENECQVADVALH